MAKQSAIEQDGTIIEALSNAMFRVELENPEDMRQDELEYQYDEEDFMG